MIRLLCCCCFLILIGCQSKKQQQHSILSAKNQLVAEKLAQAGCSCFYESVKNNFFFNRNTQLYVMNSKRILQDFNENYPYCLKQLEVNDIYELFGNPHRENEAGLYYYYNVQSNGKLFVPLIVEKDNANGIVGLKNGQHDFIYPDSLDQFHRFVKSAAIVFQDEEKLKLDQKLFPYFSEADIDKYYSPADFIQMQKPYVNDQLSKGCLQSIRLFQQHLFYNSRSKHYVKNETLDFLPFLKRNSKAYSDCMEQIDYELILEAFGAPTNTNETRDTLSYYIVNEIAAPTVTASFSFIRLQDADSYYFSYAVPGNKELLPAIEPCSSSARP